MKFNVGQKVVCVRGPINKNRSNFQPKVGSVYTIREIYPSSLTGEMGFLLEEIINNHHRNGREYGFYARRFRHVVERKTDISIFREILRKATKPARTPALSSKER